MGSLHRHKLVRAEDWEQFLEEREAGFLSTEEELDQPEEVAADGGSGGGVEVNGVLVPQLLLDRTKAALERFGVTR